LTDRVVRRAWSTGGKGADKIIWAIFASPAGEAKAKNVNR
jgi:hypothetical protein